MYKFFFSEKVVRHHYYLQLRENVKNYSQPISEEKSFLLAALALQADLGNYDEEKHKNRYFDIGNYFPSWVICCFMFDYITVLLKVFYITFYFLLLYNLADNDCNFILYVNMIIISNNS